jgi:hypothetical protein
MNAVVRDGNCYFTNNYIQYSDSNSNVGSYIKYFEYDLLKVVWELMDMVFYHVPTPEGFGK